MTEPAAPGAVRSPGSECVTGFGGKCTCPHPRYRSLDQKAVWIPIAASPFVLAIITVILTVIHP